MEQKVMNNFIVTVFGGSGFIGRHLVRNLITKGAIVRVAVRDPEDARYLMTMGDVGQVVPFLANVRDEASLEAAINGAQAVVNLVGVLSERGRQNFKSLHTQGAVNVAKAAAGAGVQSLVHISAIGANAGSESRYAQTKIAGETAVKSEFPNAIIIRPSVVFGPEDGFFNLFAGLARFTYFLPVFRCPAFPRFTFFCDGRVFKIDFYGDGGTKFQPVYVGDVAAAICTAIDRKSAKGQVYELGGPVVYSSVDIMNLILKNIGRKRILLPVPFWYLKVVGWLLQKFPAPLLTYDQVMQLKVDNIVSSKAKTLADLGINATPAEAILPKYLARFKKAGH
jgi:NADH dehydrogenase